MWEDDFNIRTQQYSDLQNQSNSLKRKVAQSAVLEKQIRELKAQEEMVAKDEKKLKALKDDRIELEKKLAENVKSQDDTIKDIDTQKQSLETLKDKRKKS